MFCFDYNVWQGYDYDYIEEHVYGDYQQIVYIFRCQEEENHLGP